MHRVLMVEDHEPTRRHFRRLLLAEMPDGDLVEAASIPEAEQIIDENVARGASFDAVILDCNLPSANGTFEMNTSLCPLVSRKFNQALVVHCSAYTESPVLQRHIKEQHMRWPSPRGCVIPKGENWDMELVRTLATDRVERRLSDFFRSDAGMAAGRSGGIGPTRRLAKLVSDIERFWKFLPDQTRQNVKRDFDLVAEGESVLVTPGGKRD